jgi:NTP pyrophosphatase (non-canonical NTP hydrolase)
MKMFTDINDITDDIQEWLREVHPDRTPDQVWSKLMEELDELQQRPTDLYEWADVLILIFDLCEMYGLDVAKGIHWKMKINRERHWELVDGKLQHTKKGK